MVLPDVMQEEEAELWNQVRLSFGGAGNHINRRSKEVAMVRTDREVFQMGNSAPESGHTKFSGSNRQESSAERSEVDSEL